MKKRVSIILAGILLVAFSFGAIAPATHAVIPKVIKCWHECPGGHYVECCKYVVPGGGSWTECEDTGYLCAW
ncbi:MAG: hypothetical protein JSV52_02005 [Candidatus Zixiibacteriota bacterium]|nr:MAG: hypothetical protein JSV52_02005 [candidate division Zixibacteria bacterium]